MTYGRWLDDTHTALIGAQAAMAQVKEVGYADAAEVVSERDRCLRALVRLVGLVSGVAQTRGSSRPADLDAAVINAVKDPTARMLLRAMPRAFTTPAHHDDEPCRSVTATFLRSAADNASVAADILAGHIDPTNGPPHTARRRDPPGRRPHRGLAEFAVVMTEFANVDCQGSAGDLHLGSPNSSADLVVVVVASQDINGMPRGTTTARSALDFIGRVG
jgi:hypothetical protein